MHVLLPSAAHPVCPGMRSCRTGPVARCWMFHLHERPEGCRRYFLHVDGEVHIPCCRSFVAAGVCYCDARLPPLDEQQAPINKLPAVHVRTVAVGSDTN